MKNLISIYVNNKRTWSLWLAVCLSLALTLSPNVWGKGASSAGQAASLARSSHGGKVLSSKDSGSSYRVKLLLDGGRVKTVNVPKSSKGRR